MNLPSMDKGKYVWQCVFPLLFTVVGADPPASQKNTRKPIAGRCFAVLSEQKFVQSRGLTQYGRISAPQNRACPRSSVVKSRLANRFQGTKNTLKEDPVMFLDRMLAGSFVLDLVAALAVRARVR